MDFKQNYFEIFQFPVRFEIDRTALASRYRALQRTVHPDKFANASAAEKRLSVQWTAQINQAFSTLGSDLSRAVYLLRLGGVTLEHNPDLDPGFLMQQIELREALEEMATSEDALAELALYKTSIASSLGQLKTDFASAYPSQPDQAEQVVYKMQFINKLLVAANQLEERLLDY